MSLPNLIVTLDIFTLQPDTSSDTSTASATENETPVVQVEVMKQISSVAAAASGINYSQ